MDHIEALLLGIVQGLTEFLPVSSSGHMTLLQNWFQINSNNVAITIVAHAGTLLAILFFYKKEFLAILKNLFKSRTSILVNPTVRLISLVFVASIPAAVVGIGFRKYFDTLFASSDYLGVFFLITSLALILSRARTKSESYEPTQTNTEYISHQITYTQALVIGISQAIAICPGISRAGFTITTGLFLGLKKQNAAFFSFLISIPAIMGATLLELDNISAIDNISSLITLFFSSLIFGFVGLWGVVYVLHRGKLHYFAAYLIPLALYLLFF